MLQEMFLSSNTANVTTTASAGVGASDLLFSEYIEGSSNNKALEISMMLQEVL
jgi:hypothetical protein